MVELNVETETADALWQAARKCERVILSVILDGELHHFHMAISDFRVTKHGSTGWRDGKPCTVALTLQQSGDGMTYQWKRFGVYANGMGGTIALVEADGQWIQAEDAIKREAELLARIHQLEERAAQAAELVSKAVGMMVPLRPVS